MTELDIGDLLIVNKNPLMVINKIPVERFENKQGNSNKFWEIFVTGKDFTTRWGKIDTEGQAQSKTFASESEAEKASSKLIEEKLNKGYKKSSVKGAFIYVFSDPQNFGKKNWISYIDLEPFMKKEKAEIQKSKH